ncbi:MAG: rRNA maturation RNase YbeY [Candidatus Gracilibacteria bacterium]|nr:rRNA maturation RNase YbeY [Candidatus Gracilibacteria bacterium]
MFKYELINLKDFKINLQIINKIFFKINILIQKDQKGTLNIVFVDSEEIQNLNKDYRNIDKITDVLSFAYFEDFSNVKDEEVAGELIFCEEKIKSQAIEFGLGEEKEFYKLLIHSILHILGFDHENDNEYEIMQNLENNIWQEIFEKKQEL